MINYHHRKSRERGVTPLNSQSKTLIKRVKTIKIQRILQIQNQTR